MQPLQIKPKILEILKNKRCLLAFSHGVDSTALFHTLALNNIDFACAFVNYKTRQNSDIEELSARNLCKEFNKKIFVKIAKLDLENGSNFEQTARDIRWKFFEEICESFGYDAIISAHQLNDLLEWFLMQFFKGSGVVNLIGMQEIYNRNNFLVIKPLLFTPRDEILHFLTKNKIKFFEDISNSNLKFKRNSIRHKFSNEMIKEFQNGIIKSFEFLNNDRSLLLGEFIWKNDEFFIIKKEQNAINLIDKACKKLGVVMSEKQREQIKQDCVISAKICICSNEKLYFVCPYVKNISMQKSFKEKCRILKIPPLIRGYIYNNQEIIKIISSLV